MKKNVFEIYLTSQFVESKEWLKLIYKISKINGILKPWKLWVKIENNYIRYFIETKRMLPPIIGDLGSFLLKNIDYDLKEKSVFGIPYLLTNNYKTILDVYDKNEARNMQKLKNIIITFYPYKSDNYLSTTQLYFETEDGRVINRKAIGNRAIFQFLSIDFGKHTRFFYKKEETKYLDTKKVMNILSSDKENSILKANVFPYLQEDLYLSYRNYDFAKHSIVIGASRYRKIKNDKFCNKKTF